MTPPLAGSPREPCHCFRRIENFLLKSVESHRFLTKGYAMGGEPWQYFVPFEKSVEAALEKLRERVFESGEFNGSESMPATPAEALENSAPDGTRSILDMMLVGDSPDYCTVCPLPEEQLQTLFGTTQPTHKMIESNHGFYEDIERGQGIYIVVYKDGAADEYLFAGYSFD